MPTWPTTLPLPQQEGYGLEPQQAFLRTDVDQGPAIQRRRFSSSPTDIPLNLDLTNEQFETFEAWYHYEILDGASWFNMTLYNGNGLNTVEARFKSVYKAAPKGGLSWVVTATLESRNMPLISEAELATRL